MKLLNVNEEMIKLIKLLRQKEPSLKTKAQIRECLIAHNDLILSSGFTGTFRDEVRFSKRDLSLLNAPQDGKKFWDGEIVWDYYADEEGLHNLNWYYYRVFTTDEEAEEDYPIWTWIRPWHMTIDILGENSGHANDGQLGMLYDLSLIHI